MLVGTLPLNALAEEPPGSATSVERVFTAGEATPPPPESPRAESSTAAASSAPTSPSTSESAPASGSASASSSASAGGSQSGSASPSTADVPGEIKSSSEEPSANAENRIDTTNLPQEEGRAPVNGQQVWNASAIDSTGNVVAAYQDGATTTPIALTSGMTLTVAKGAAGTLVVPAGVDSLTLNGPGYTETIESKGNIRIDNPAAVTLNITDLVMTGGDGNAFLVDSNNHGLHLNLNRVQLTGGAGSSSIAAPNATVELKAKDAGATLVGGQSGGHALTAKMATLNGAFFIQGGDGGGYGLDVGGVNLTSGKITIKSGAAAVSITGANGLTVGKDAVVTLAGGTGVVNPQQKNIDLRGGLTVTATVDAAFDGGTVLFSDTSAKLTVKEPKSGGTVSVALASGLTADHELYPMDNLSLDAAKATAVLGSGTGSVVVGGRQVWNAEKDGVAAYTDAGLKLTTPISLTDGLTLPVTQSAGGVLTIPQYVSGLALVGSGLAEPVSGKGRIEIAQARTLTLKISDLAMESGEGSSFLTGVQKGSVTLELENVALTGGTATGSGISLPNAEVTLTAAGSVTLTGGTGIAVKSLVVASGDVTAQGGTQAANSGVSANGSLEVAPGATLSATGGYGVNVLGNGTVRLGGRLTATATAAGGSAVNGLVWFIDAAARLTVQEAQNQSRTISLSLSGKLFDNYSLYAVGGAKLTQNSVSSGDTAGIVFLGSKRQVWNASMANLQGGGSVAAYNDGVKITPITFTNGMELTVLDGAAGTLPVPEGITSLTLTGLGVEYPVSTQGSVWMQHENSDIFLSINGLAMQGIQGMAFAVYNGSHTLSLNLNNAALTGGGDAPGLEASMGAVKLNAQGSVTLTGGAASQGAGGAGISAGSLTVVSGSISAQGGAGQGDAGNGISVWKAPGLRVEEGASLSAVGASGVYSRAADITLGGSLSATATQADGSAVKLEATSAVSFASGSAKLTVQESSGQSCNLPVQLDGSVADDCELLAQGGVSLNAGATHALTSDRQGTVIARRMLVWNAQEKGAAAHSDGGTATPLVLADGLSVKVEEGAQGVLTIPDGVDNLFLWGPGLDTALSSTARIVIRNSNATTLTISGLNMRAGASSAFLLDSVDHPLTLNLTDVALAGDIGNNALDALFATVTLNARGSVTLSGGENGGIGAYVTNLTVHGDLTAQGGASTNGMGGDAIFARTFTVASGTMTAVGGTGASRAGMGVRVLEDSTSRLTVQQGAALSATGHSGVYAIQSAITLAGSLTATCTGQGGAAFRSGSPVTFTTPSATLTATEFSTGRVPVALDTGLKGYRLEAAGGASLDASRTTATFSQTAGTVSVGVSEPVWNAQLQGRAAYDNGVETKTLVLTDGMILEVQEGAAGTLVIPQGVDTLSLVGPGLDRPIASKGAIGIQNSKDMTLNVTGLAMQMDRGSFIDSANSHTLTLNLEDVALAGKAAGVQATSAAVKLNAQGSVTITGGEGSTYGGYGIWADSLTVQGGVTVQGSGTGVNVRTSFTVAGGDVTVIGSGGHGVFVESVDSDGNVTVAAGASLNVRGEGGVSAFGHIALAGSLKAIGTARQAVSGRVNFTDATAKLTVQERAGGEETISVALENALTADYTLQATGGVTLNESKTKVTTSDKEGTVSVGEAKPVWNAQQNGAAAYANSGVTRPLVLTDGMTLEVREGAAGQLTIPEGVNTLFLVGPGLGVPIKSKGNIRVENPGSTTLSITGLAMEAPENVDFLADYMGKNILHLTLDDVVFKGGMGTDKLIGKRGIAAPNRSVMVTARNSVTLYGGQAGMATGGHGMYIKDMTLSAGNVAVYGGAGVTAGGSGISTFGYSHLRVAQGASLSAQGASGVGSINEILLAGSLKATALASTGAAVSGSVTFTDPAAKLTVQQKGGGLSTIAVAMDAALAAEHILRAGGGVRLSDRNIATVTSTEGTVDLEHVGPVRAWNTQQNGAAAYTDGKITRTIVPTDGMTLAVQEGAAGQLTIPDGVNTLSLVGPGLNTPLASKGNILIENTQNTTLHITGLDMKAPVDTAFLRDEQNHTLSLILDDVAFAGGDRIKEGSTGEGIYVLPGSVTVTARNSVTVYGGTKNANSSVGYGMKIQNMTLTAGSMTVYGGETVGIFNNTTAGYLQVAQGASLSVTGMYGLFGVNTDLAGSLTVKSVSAKAIGSANNGTVTFTNPAARLTVQEASGKNKKIAVALDAALAEYYQLSATGGVTLNAEGTTAFTSDQEGTVFVRAGGLNSVWNAQVNGAAAYNDGTTTVPLTPVDGTKVLVQEGAAGSLVIPDGVNTLSLVGPGLDTPIESKGTIRIENPKDMTLRITGLAMQGHDGAFLCDRISHTLKLNLDGVALTGPDAKGEGGHGVWADKAAVRLAAENSVALTGGRGQTSTGGHGVYADELAVSGVLTAQGGAGSGGQDGAGVFLTPSGSGSLSVAAGASLTAVGHSGVGNAKTTLLNGSLKATATGADGSALSGGAVTFMDVAAQLTVQEEANQSRTIPVVMDAALPVGSALVTTGGVKLNDQKSEVATSGQEGTVAVRFTVWNAQLNGNAAYHNGITTVPITLVDGMTLQVREGAEGSLTVPTDVGKLSLIGPGLNSPIQSKGQIRLATSKDMTLSITDLAMQADRESFIVTTITGNDFSLTLNLDDVALTGGDDPVAGGGGVTVYDGTVELTARGSVTLAGGKGGKSGGGSGILSKGLTIRGSLTARGGDAIDLNGVDDQYSAGIVIYGPLAIEEGTVTASGGRSATTVGIGVFFDGATPGHRRSLYVAEGASLDTRGRIGLNQAHEVTLGGSLKAAAIGGRLTAINNAFYDNTIITFTNAAAKLTVQEHQGNTNRTQVALAAALAADHTLVATGGVTLDNAKTTATTSGQEGTVAVQSGFALTVAGGAGGSVSGAATGRYGQGETLTVTATPEPGFLFTGWTAAGLTLTEAQKAARTLDFTMPANDLTLTAHFGPAAPSHVHDYSDGWSSDAEVHWHACRAGDGARVDKAAHTPGAWMEIQAATATQAGLRCKQCTVCGYVTEMEPLAPTGPAYTYRTLTDPDTGVSVSGYFTANAALRVRGDGLHPEDECEACDGIRARQAAGELLVLHNIGLSAGRYTGMLEVAIPVGEAYEGQTVLVLHCKNEVLESRSLVVQDGVVKDRFNRLSFFGVAAGSQSESGPVITGLPHTYTMEVDQTVVWTPAPTGGAWSYDKDLLSIARSGDDYQVKALKPGLATATYEVDGVPFSVTIIINEGVPAQTDAPRSWLWLWLLVLLAAVLAGGGVWLAWHKKRRAGKQA